MGECECCGAIADLKRGPFEGSLLCSHCYEQAWDAKMLDEENARDSAEGAVTND